MRKSKLVSVRIDEELLNKIDQIVDGSVYYNRSTYIQAGLKLMVEMSKHGFARDAIRFCPEFGDIVDKIVFKYHRGHK